MLADDTAACAEVARAIKIPVATGENNYSRFEFRELIERRAARYLMPDVGRANGFSETMKIARLAAAHQVLVSPHVVHELSLQVVGAIPNGFLVEYMELGAGRPLRGPARVRGRPVPHPRPAGPRDRAGARRHREVPRVVKVSRGVEDDQPSRSVTASGTSGNASGAICSPRAATRVLR